MKRTSWFLIKLTLSTLTALLIGGIGYLFWALSQPVQRGTELYTIAPGSGVGQIARGLVEHGVLNEPYSLIVWTYLQGTTGNMHAGEYSFNQDLTLRELYQQILAGKVKQYPVTIVEGWTFNQMIDTLRQSPKLEKTVVEQDAQAIMKALGHPEQHPEGRFFPDTYYYNAGTRDVDILRKAYQRMSEHLAQAWEQRAGSLAIEQPEQALILASIIEKETSRADERGIVSGVFHNRLRKGMRLQTDPTVIYGLGKDYSGNLTRKHLQSDTPYNTYTRTGLPPTPIALPGAASLQAAVNPVATEALYFVARPDGSHVFSKTLSEHNRAVIQHQLGGVPKAFSSHPGTGTGAGKPEENAVTDGKNGGGDAQ